MPAPLSVDEALARILDGVAPMPAEAVAIEAAHRRTLAEPLAALLTQPPFDASAMDGYAVRAGDVAKLPATLAVIGEAAAGHPFAGDGGPRTGRAHLHRRAAAGRRRRRRHPGEHDAGQVRARRGQGDRARGHARPWPRAHHGLRFPHRRRAARCRPATGAARGVARGRHGPRHASRAPAPARGRHLDRGRAAAAGRQAGARTDHLLQPPGRAGAGGGLGRRRSSSSASPATRARAWQAQFARAEGADVIVTIGGASVGRPRSGRPGAAGSAAWPCRSGTLRCGPASR